MVWRELIARSTPFTMSTSLRKIGKWVDWNSYPKTVMNDLLSEPSALIGGQTAQDSSSKETSASLRLLTGAKSNLLAQQILLDLWPSCQIDGFFFVLLNICVPLFEPRVLGHWFFIIYTVLNLGCNVIATFYLRLWSARVAANATHSALWFTIFKALQNAGVGILTAWCYWQFGINPITSLATMAVAAFAVGVIVSLRPSLIISRLSMLCCLLPAAVSSAWVGGRAGYGTACVMGLNAVFLWLWGNSENREYWRVLRQTRELMLSRRKASREGARIGDALLSNAARHSAIVAERNRIAYEWHDTLLAGFSAISWQLEEAKRRQRETPETAAEAIELAANMLQHYRTEARLVIADLLYEEDGSYDLVAFITKRAREIISAASIELKVSTCGNAVPIPPDSLRQLLRICEEAITNAVNHACPTHISIRVENGPKLLFISIADNGIGFDTSANAPGHFGLHIMKQRARRLNGDLQIESIAGAGSTISVSIPYSTDFHMTPTRILVIEDQYFSRLALHTVIDRHSDMQIVGEADSAQGGLALFQTYSPDVVIVDLKLPDGSGIDLIKAIRKIDPLARIVVLSNFDGSEYLYRATDAGAMAYLTKDASADELATAIRAVRIGQSFIPPSLLHLLENRVAGNDLTLREKGVLQLLVLGWSNRQIGNHLGIAEKTVRIHLSSIFGKLGAANRTQAVLIALQSGFVDAPIEGKVEHALNNPLIATAGEEN